MSNAARQTVVTCLFDVQGITPNGQNVRPLALYQAHSGLTLSQPAPLVAFVDPGLTEWVWARRRQFGQQHQTTIIERRVQELPRADQLADLERLAGQDGGDSAKDRGWPQLVNWSKVHLLAEAAAMDPFETGNFAWMDLGLGHVARHPITFPAPNDRPALLQMRPLFPEELGGVHQRELGRMAGGFIRGRAGELIELDRLFDEEFVRALEQGRRPSDQTILTALSARHPDFFEFTFGDYASILINWDLVRRDERIVLENIAHCRRFQRWEEALYRCQLLRRSVEAGVLDLSRPFRQWLTAEEQIVDAHLAAPSSVASSHSTPPRVTVILPTTGDNPDIEGAARSVLAQSVGDLELIIQVEGGSSAEAMARAMADGDGRVSVLADSAGHRPAIPDLAHAPGEAPYVAAITPDDRWLPGKLELQLSLLEDESTEAVESGFFMDPRWGPLERRRAPRGKFDRAAPLTSTAIFRRRFAGEGTVRRVEKALSVGPEPPARAELTTRSTIALCMIVRNESAVITRCLNSVRDVIDNWVIVDTGSTDDTEERVRRALAGIPGQLHRRPWRDFAANRSEALALARGSADYLLLMDADMTLVEHAALPNLVAGAYLIPYEGSFRYSVPRLVRGDLPFHYVGATHEYLGCDELFTSANLEAWAVLHHADGGSRADKLTRDRDLLERQRHDTPDDPRTLFYLAQTYRDLGDRARAAQLYRQRVDLGGWGEEVYYAALQLGMLVADEDWPAGLSLLANAWEMRPTRAEALYEIAIRARNLGDIKMGDWATSLGVDIAMPDDVLFVHGWVYEWGLRLERSIVAGQIGHLDEAISLTESLLMQDGLPDDVKAALHANRQWFQQQAASRPVRQAPRPAGGPALLAEICPGVEFIPLPRAPVAPGWNQTNPSIANGPGGLTFVARSVNYELVDGRYRVDDPQEVVRTVNTLVELDGDLRAGLHREMQEPVGLVCHQTGVAGFEDCRLFWWQESWWASATCRDLNPDGVCQIVLLSAGVDGWQLEATLSGPLPDRHEKNWMPFVVGEELHFVYLCRPFTVLRFDRDTRVVQQVRRLPTDPRFAGMRGSTQGLAIDDGFLFVTHTAQGTGPGRRYLHHFVAVDGSLTPSGISPPFVFVHDGIEFCAGLARRGDDLLLSFGIEDRCAAMVAVPLDAVIDALEPVAGS